MSKVAEVAVSAQMRKRINQGKEKNGWKKRVCVCPEDLKYERGEDSCARRRG